MLSADKGGNRVKAIYFGALASALFFVMFGAAWFAGTWSNSRALSCAQTSEMRRVNGIIKKYHPSHDMWYLNSEGFERLIYECRRGSNCNLRIQLNDAVGHDASGWYCHGELAALDIGADRIISKRPLNLNLHLTFALILGAGSILVFVVVWYVASGAKRD